MILIRLSKDLTRLSRPATLVRALALIAALGLTSMIVWSSTRTASVSDRFGRVNRACANPIFEPVLPELQSRTSVPLRLPLIVGGDYDAALYAKVFRVNREGYLVRIGQNCEHGYCPYGTVSGRKLSSSRLRPRGKAIELTGGITGYVTDGSRRLRDSSITWDQGGYRYSISVYAKEADVMIKIANSALSCDSK